MEGLKGSGSLLFPTVGGEAGSFFLLDLTVRNLEGPKSLAGGV